jgi:mRNA interferase RelE/StbE
LAYNITFKKSVSKDLKKIIRSDIVRIFNKLDSDLSQRADQFPELQGSFAGLRKYKVGDYRIIYAILQDAILIVRIQHRKDVYRK